MNEIIQRHERIALQFSGGRDSLACLYLMRPYWDRIRVYWLNAGDPFPETLALMAKIRDQVPHFIEVQGRQPEVIAEGGIPSDLVPVNRTPIGLVGTRSNEQPIQDRYTCCVRSRMIPLHERMIEDDITLIIRGQKNSDRLKGPLRSGQVDGGIEYLFPIEDWTTGQVNQFLQEQGVKLPKFYVLLNSAPDCMTCSAYWEEGVSAYLKRYHYPAYETVQARLDAIQQAVAGHIQHFNAEVNT